MHWFYTQIFDEDICEDFYITKYNEKMLGVDVLYETENQTILKAIIIVPDKEKQTDVIEYYYERVFVGMGDDFLKKVNNIIKNKISELEIIASEKDSEILSRN